MENNIKKGQIWSYKTREGEDDSRLIILNSETLNAEEIIHIRISNLKIKDLITGEVIADSIEHLPISKDKFMQSVLKIEGKTHVELEEGYFSWKRAFESGKAGIWSVEVKEVVNMTEQSCNI